MPKPYQIRNSNGILVWHYPVEDGPPTPLIPRVAPPEPEEAPTLFVTGLAKNCGLTIRPLLESIEAITKPFTSVRYAIVCDAADHILRKRLAQWYADHPNTCTLIPDTKARPGGDTRYAKMARLRNLALNHAHIWTDWILSVDMDIKELIDEGGVQDVINAPASVGAVATYGLMPRRKLRTRTDESYFNWRGEDYAYYDLLAFESTDRQRMLWRLYNGGGYYPHSENGPPPAAKFTTKNIVPPIGIVTEINSAFGPATFYRSTAVAGLRYDERSLQIEHYFYNADVRKQGYKMLLNGKIIGLYA